MQSYLAEQAASEDGQFAKGTESSEPTEFPSVLEGYECAEKKFGGPDSPLVFFESARRSAAESPYNSPELVYELLKELHKLALLWKRREGKLGQRWEDALAPTGFEYKPGISQTTKGKFGDEYRFNYDGRKPLFEEHITKGAKHPHSCFSIHLYRDDKKLRLVIGHCGKHLSTTTT